MLGWAVCSWIAGTASATSSPPARTAETSGRRSTRSMIAPQIAPLAVVAAQPVDERHAAAVDLVAELREQRRQHGQRAEHRDGDDGHRRDAEGGEGGVGR